MLVIVGTEMRCSECNYFLLSQALGFVHGAQIIHAPEPIHGRLRWCLLWTIRWNTIFHSQKVTVSGIHYCCAIIFLTFSLYYSVKLSTQVVTSSKVFQQEQNLVSKWVYTFLATYNCKINSIYISTAIHYSFFFPFTHRANCWKLWCYVSYAMPIILHNRMHF